MTLDDAVANLVFSGLSMEQMQKLPKWLLENIENNKPQLTTLINKEKAKAELAGRKEQVMQDFMSAVVDFDIDESLIIAWRDRQLAELQAQLTKGKEKEL